MKLPNQIKNSIKDTIGHRESDNKVEFMKGADVAYGIAERYYEKEIASLEQRLKFMTDDYNKVSDDIKTLSKIIVKYSDHD